jgi:hypothetical protein
MKHIYTFILLFISFSISAQNTVGTISNSPGSYNGYTLLAPLASTETYLINNCGQIINQWSSNYLPAASAYLLENGNLLRTGKIKNDIIQFGGVGGAIELYDWEGNLLWEYIYSTTEVSQNHDIFPLPNGNILMLAVTTMTEIEAIQAGRDPSKIEEGKLYNQQILELEPVNTNEANVVWEWNIKDHLIQDFDNSKDNFGVVADNPQLLDINYLNSDKGSANWLHMNSIQYNATLDQIVMSSRLLSEIYIIDHSTSTTLSASHTGGIYGKGGDLLYRWGNPEAYDHGTSNNRILFGPHYPHWIPGGLTDEGKVMIFNNVSAPFVSTLDIITLPETSPGIYDYDQINGYAPLLPDWRYTSPEPTDFFSAILSSGQRLPNGNTLICDGDSGYFFEIDINENIVWEYINPDTASGILSQGDTPVANLVFRAHKFSMDYPAFQGRDLTPGNPIELNPDLSNCSLLSIAKNNNDLTGLRIHPNPSKNYFSIESSITIEKIEMYDLMGKLIKTNFNTEKISIQELTNGLYILKMYSNGKVFNRKVLKY